MKPVPGVKTTFLGAASDAARPPVPLLGVGKYVNLLSLLAFGCRCGALVARVLERGLRRCRRLRLGFVDPLQPLLLGSFGGFALPLSLGATCLGGLGNTLVGVLRCLALALLGPFAGIGHRVLLGGDGFGAVIGGRFERVLQLGTGLLTLSGSGHAPHGGFATNFAPPGQHGAALSQCGITQYSADRSVQPAKRPLIDQPSGGFGVQAGNPPVLDELQGKPGQTVLQSQYL